MGRSHELLLLKRAHGNIGNFGCGRIIRGPVAGYLTVAPEVKVHDDSCNRGNGECDQGH